MMHEKCDKCKNLTRFKSLRMYKRNLLCYNCFLKEINLIGDYLPKKFEEPLDQQMILNISFTKSQKKLFFERLKFIFPNRKSNKRGQTEYFRSLMLNDLENWNKSRHTNKKSSKEEN